MVPPSTFLTDAITANQVELSPDKLQQRSVCGNPVLHTGSKSVRQKKRAPRCGPD